MQTLRLILFVEASGYNMGKLYDSYQVYKEKGERMEPTEYLRQYTNDAELKALFDGAVRIGTQTKSMCGSNKYDGTYLAKDGRVFEKSLMEFNYSVQVRIWASKESYDKHREVMPFSIWAWG